MSFIVPYKGNFAVQADAPIQFTVPAGTTRYSAGIYKNGNLIRTLVSNKNYVPDETIFWDGIDDSGKLCSFGTYDLVITSNNLTSSWLGVAGNTSDSFTGSSVHRGLDTIAGMVYAASGYVYFITNYEEQSGSLYKFQKDTPNTRIRVYPASGSPAMRFICSDGNKLYFGSYRAGSTINWFIHALTIAGETDYTFPSGVLTGGNNVAAGNIYSAIGYDDYVIRGLDVQQSGNYLLAALYKKGIVTSLSNLVGGTGYIDGTYSNVPLTKSDNKDYGLRADITVSGGVVIIVSLVYGGQNFQVGDTLITKKANLGNPATGGTGFTIKVAGITDSGIIKTFDKNTGDLINTTEVAHPEYPCIDNTDNNLWLISNNVPTKYSINPDGTLTATGITAPGVSQAVGAGMSYNRQTLMICDAGVNQQIKSYDTNGVSVWTLGQQGGYTANAIAANNKFNLYFETTDTTPDYYYSYVCTLPDGSFWIGDPGNRRNLLFSNSRSRLNTIQYLPRNYFVSVDKNDIKRAFSGMLEFQLDYDNVRNWVFKANWASNLPSTMLGNTMLQPCTLTATNNEKRTFAFINDSSFSPNRRKLHELKADGTLRDTGVFFASNTFTQLYEDGSLRRFTTANPKTFYRADWNGTFDVNGNPIWGAEYLYATLPDNSIGGLGDSNTSKAGEITTSGKLIAFSNDKTVGYHLAGVDISSGKYSFLTCPSTFANYTGDFPTDGSYDIGNLVNNTAIGMVTGNFIAWLYYGEGWKNLQTNVINLFSDNGQMLLQFGYPASKVNDSSHNPTTPEATAGVGGNSKTPAMVLYNNKLFVIHGDESSHSGFQIWQVDGLNTINRQTIPVDFAIKTNGVLSRFTKSLGFSNTSTHIKRIGNYLAASYFPLNAVEHTIDFHLQAPTTETFTLYFNTNNGIKVYVDKVVKVDQLTNASQTEFSTSMSFVSGKFYTIKIEQVLRGNKKLDMQWSSNTLAKQPIPRSKTFPPEIITRPFISLLEDLPLFANNYSGGYGWTVSPAPYTRPSSNLFNVSTNAISVVNTTTGKTFPDISIDITKSSTDNTDLQWSVGRDLGNNSGISWQLNLQFHIAYTQYAIGSGLLTDDSGCFIEILDSNGLSICRFWWNTDSTNTYIYVRFNDTMIVQDAYDTVRLTVYTLQSLVITGSNGVLTAKYGSYNLVSTSNTCDLGADITAPKTMRVYAFAKSGKRLTSQTINISDATFKTNK